jgi:hypothetical protein
VDDVTKPDIGRIDRVCIKRKTRDFIKLADRREFDLKTGRSLHGEPKYIFTVEDRRVRVAWEPQPLRQRVERVLSALRFADVRNHADLLCPGWHFGLFADRLDGVLGRNFDRPAASLSEREEASMVSCRRFAKEAVLSHLPRGVQELRALVEMMEGDAK